MAEEPDAELVIRAAGDADARTRLLAAWALVANAELEAPKALTRLLADDDPNVLALAAKAAGQVRKDVAHTERLAEILLAADPAKAAGAVLEAAIGLAAIAKEHGEMRGDAQAALLDALEREYPEDIRAAALVASLKGLHGYDEPDGLDPFRALLGKDYPLPVRTLAAERTLTYQEAIFDTYEHVRKDEALGAQPELMTRVLQAVRGRTMLLESPLPRRENAATAFELLNSARYADRRYGLVRVALVENVFLAPNPERLEYLTGLLRTDRDWRVRRAVLACLAGLDQRGFQTACDLALEDPHPVIKQIALAGLIALRAPDEKRDAYLGKLAGQPSAATCEAILKAEGIAPELAMRPAEEIRETLEG